MVINLAHETKTLEDKQLLSLAELSEISSSSIESCYGVYL